MNRFRVIVEYTDGTSELVTMLGDFNITEEESLKLVETQLKTIRPIRKGHRYEGETMNEIEYLKIIRNNGYRILHGGRKKGCGDIRQNTKGCRNGKWMCQQRH